MHVLCKAATLARLCHRMHSAKLPGFGWRGCFSCCNTIVTGSAWHWPASAATAGDLQYGCLCICPTHAASATHHQRHTGRLCIQALGSAAQTAGICLSTAVQTSSADVSLPHSAFRASSACLSLTHVAVSRIFSPSDGSTSTLDSLPPTLQQLPLTSSHVLDLTELP